MTLREQLEALVIACNAGAVAALTRSYDLRERAKRINSQARGALKSTLASDRELKEHLTRLGELMADIEQSKF